MRRLSQRRSFRALAIVGITLFVAACAPTFPSGAKIAPAPTGGLIKITWNAGSSGTNRYRIDVNGAQVASVNAPTTNCVLTGLAASTTYALKVTALNSANEGSSPLSLSYTTPAAGNAGTTKACFLDRH